MKSLAADDVPFTNKKLGWNETERLQPLREQHTLLARRSSSKMTNATRAEGFVQSLGVNTHIQYTDGGYANLSNIDADLKYLGIDHVRDGISTGGNGSAPLSSYITLAQEGVKFTFIAGGSTTAGLQSELATIDRVNEAAPGSVVALEGPNEINNWPITYNGVGGLQGAVNFQQDLYKMVHSDPNLRGAAVDYFTGYDAGGVGTGPNPATTSGLADYDNQHPYPVGGEPPASAVNRGTLGNESPPTGAAVYTETGYTTTAGSWATGVNQDVQAKYGLDLFMDAASQGIASTDWYELMDAYQPGSPQGDAGFGLFDPNNQPKEAATAIHNLTSILADPEASAASFTPGTLNYSVSGEPSGGHDFLMQKASGAYDIAVWNEPNIWNASKSTEVQAAPVSETVNLGQIFASVSVYDPLQGTTPIRTLSNVSSLSLSVTDHPLIVEASGGASTSPTPTPTPTPSPPPPTVSPHQLQLLMSEDAWRGNAQFIVKVDGKQVGGTETVTALHKSGQTQAFNFTPSLAAGTHDIAISFINDAYGGTASTDRNLYVNQVSYDGQSALSQTLRLFSNGTVHVTVGHS